MRHVEPNGDVWFGIHEVFYADDDAVENWTEHSTKPFGETIEELRSDLTHFEKALTLPVLDYASGKTYDG